MLAAASSAAVALVALAPAASACGGLIGENGTIQLVRTTTLAAYHDGIERYVTSFEFTGEGEEVGSIIPLPGVPTDVKRGGDWTLQRLAREVAPQPKAVALSASFDDAAAGSARVLLETKVDALDITILEGGGDEVGLWAADNGFLLTPDAPEVLDFYARRSPIFMAAKFDAGRAAELGQRGGDGTPIMLTIRGCRSASSDSASTKRRPSRRTCSCSRTIGRTCSPVAQVSRSPEAARPRTCCSTTSAPTSAWSGFPRSCG
jgi:hypothetical protein